MWLAYFLTFYIPFVAILCYSGRTAIQNSGYTVSVRRNYRDYMFIILAYLPLMVMACLRSENVGNDNAIYINFFYHVQEELAVSTFSIDTRFEPGFVIYNKILASLFNTPQALLFVSSFFILASVIRTITKYSRSVWLSVFLFFCINFNATMVTMRQYIAIGILLFSFDFIIQRKLKKFLLVWLLACSFHYTAFVFLFAYFAYNLKVNKKIIGEMILVLPVAILLSFTQLQPFLNIFHDEGMYEYYNSQNKYVAGGVKLATFVVFALDGIVVLVSGIIFKVTKSNNKLNKDGLNRVLFIFSMIGFFIVGMSFPFNLFSRVATYFAIFNCILIPNALHELTQRRKYDTANILSASFTILYGAYYLVINIYRPEWTNIYPYEFCFSL